MAITFSGSTASFCFGGRAWVLRMPLSTATCRSPRSKVSPRWRKCQASAESPRSIVATEFGLRSAVAAPEAQAVI
jgi:hypothetical protein